MADKAKVCIIGAGLMGHGIAQVFAAAGHAVSITDPIEAARESVRAKITKNLLDLGLDPSAADRIAVAPDLPSAVADADIAIEAAPENLELKQDIFRDLETVTPSHTLLASNTSVIPITRIMEKVKDQSRTLGTHWWNPPYLVPLVEVIRTAHTADAAVAKTMELLASVGKTPVEVKKDVPGFVGNRLQHALWREAMSIVQSGICDAETVDTVVKASFGRRLPVIGPLENSDLVGSDLSLAIHQYVLPHLDRTPGALPILEALVRDGKLGFKTGEGFRKWTPEQQDELRKRVFDHLVSMQRQGV